MEDAGDPTSQTEHETAAAESRWVPAKIVVIAGPDEGAEIFFDTRVSVGTSSDNDLVLDDDRVSRRHATFSRDGGRVVVVDHDSSNGTFVNGIRIREAEVSVGAVVLLGRRTALAVRPRWYAREVPPSSRGSFGGLLGQSLAMREVFGILERVAATDLTVLLEGETGTGKEVAARSIHDASARAQKPYVVFDCGSVPRDLAESELFGHKRGAFTGATADRVGVFQRAHGGTVLLDEVGELPLELQPKLLRVLESSEVRAVGDDATRKVDVRVIAATNRELRAEVARGAFREDLLHRLAVVRIRIPPLRNRPEEILALSHHLLKGRIDPEGKIDGDNLRRLMGYPWPGNVRELRNVLHRAAAMATRPGASPPQFSDLVFNLGEASEVPTTIGYSFPGVDTSVPYKQAKERLLAVFERTYAQAVLERHHGNITRAAEDAGLSRKHMRDLWRRCLGGGDPTDEAEEPDPRSA